MHCGKVLGALAKSHDHLQGNQRVSREGRQNAVQRLDEALAHMNPVFRDLRASEITSDKVQRYIERRQQAGATLTENNVRSGFFEHEDFLGLRGALPDYAQVPVPLVYAWKQRTAERSPNCPWICHRNGQRLASIPTRMAKGCQAVGLGQLIEREGRKVKVWQGKVPHDSDVPLCETWCVLVFREGGHAYFRSQDALSL